MSLADITSADVVRAIAEADPLGRDRFLRTYGFDAAWRCVLLHNGNEYDSKAIVGVGHGFVPGQKPLTVAEFTGGTQGAVRILDRLGYHVVDQMDGERSPGEDLVALATRPHVSRVGGQPALYQPIALLWAAGRARRGGERLLPWADTERELNALLKRYGMRGERPSTANGRPCAPTAMRSRRGAAPERRTFVV